MRTLGFFLSLIIFLSLTVAAVAALSVKRNSNLVAGRQDGEVLQAERDVVS